jgi:hypothetical protein
MRNLLVAVLLLLPISALPVVAKEQSFVPKANGQVEFSMPSGNVGCIFTPEGGTDTYQPDGGGPELSCDRIEPSYINVRLGPVGKAMLNENPGEQGCCGAENVLAYGNTTHLGGFVCTASTGGLTCETADGRHGFCVAKARMLHY